MHTRLAVSGFLALIAAVWLYSFIEERTGYRIYEEAAIAVGLIGFILLCVGLFPEEK